MKSPAKSALAFGDRFSEDPFVLFQLRGRTKEQIITELRQLRSSGQSAEEMAAAPAIDMAIDPHRFWHYDEQLEPSLVVITPPPSSETVLDVLGAIPLKSETSNNQAAMSAQLVLEYLKTIYSQVSQQAVLAAMTTGRKDS